MKFNVSSKALKDTLSAIGKVIPAKSPMSIMENVLLIVDGDKLRLRGSDQENVMSTSVEIMDVEGNGALALPARRLLDYVKEIPDQGVKFFINDDTREVELRYNNGFNNGSFRFMSLDGSEYPDQKPREEDALVTVIPARTLLAGIDSTLYAVSADRLRPILTGICLDFHENKMVFAASDTHKLVKFETDEVIPGFERRAVIPARSAALLKGILEKLDLEVKIVLDSKGATFYCGEYEFSCLFITGVFPNYEKVIPQTNAYEVDVERGALLAAMRRMSLACSEGSKLVRFALESNEMLASASDTDYGRAGSERVPCTYDGVPMKIGFNCTHVLETLNNFRDDNVKIKISDPARPALFLPAEQSGEGSVVVLMLTLQLLD